MSLRDEILHLYSRLHAAEVVHNDAQARHIRPRPKTGKPTPVDMEGARFVGSDAKACRAEMKQVRRKLRDG